ncbi:MAG: hypothetical protein FWE58_00070 [Methanobrevibacter sp.]|nr:hypothetical protein [Methanobrevibacter sp.]
MNKRTTIVVFLFLYLFCSFESISSAEKGFDIGLYENKHEHCENSTKHKIVKDLLKNLIKYRYLKIFKQMNEILRNEIIAHDIEQIDEKILNFIPNQKK